MSLSVKFINRSLGAVSFLWTFGDGSTSTQQNPTHTYSDAGAYVVTLRATGPAGSSYATKVVYPVGTLTDVLMGAATGDVLADADGDQIAVPPPEPLPP